MTPKERREALARCWVDSLTGRAGVLDRIMPLVESWLAEKDADITGLRSLIEAYEYKFVAKNAEIERLRNDLRETEVLVPDPESVERELDERLADERRHTAEEIKRRIKSKQFATRSTGIVFTYLGLARICDEVGGNE